jgi:hypothetical protein
MQKNMFSAQRRFDPLYLLMVLLFQIVFGEKLLAQTNINHSKLSSENLSSENLARPLYIATSHKANAIVPTDVASNVNEFTTADYQKHVGELRKKIPSNDFHIVLQKPFIVIGDESLERVRSRSLYTVKWAVDLLKKNFFKKNPNQIIDIWLFKNKRSYEKHCKEIFDITPSTPYGFYSSTKKALIMNISTGGGTLVHEIVHPFIESNFPSCPSWFNEGLASLYEQSKEENKKIVGLTNWRLRGLQIHIKDNKVPSFKELCSTSTYQFYQQDPGTNYSQARYLCYFLQQKGKLRTFYHEFVRNSKSDPTGFETLKKVLGETDMDDFKKKWERSTMELRF